MMASGGLKMNLPLLEIATLQHTLIIITVNVIE